MRGTQQHVLQIPILSKRSHWEDSSISALSSFRLVRDGTSEDKNKANTGIWTVSMLVLIYYVCMPLSQFCSSRQAVSPWVTVVSSAEMLFEVQQVHSTPCMDPP